MPVTTVTREQLYERVWQTPTVHLCQEFGLSDVGFAKLCKRYKIPKPYLGYWARKAAGGNPTRLRLPKCSDPSLAEIQLLHSEVPMRPSGFFDPEIEALYEAEVKRDRIVVPAELDSPERPTTCERTRVGISPAAGCVPHEAHERLTLPVREIREESNQVSEIGGHPKWSGIWSGIFLDCGISRGFCNNSTPRGGT